MKVKMIKQLNYNIPNNSGDFYFINHPNLSDNLNDLKFNIFDIEKHKWKLRWDYNGLRDPYTQEDWNVTLATKINQISAQIHQATLFGGATNLMISSNLSKFLDYTFGSDYYLNRYKIDFSDKLDDNLVIVYNSNVIRKPYYLEFTDENSVDKDGKPIQGSYKLKSMLFDDLSVEQIEEHYTKGCGIIKVENYG